MVMNKVRIQGVCIDSMSSDEYFIILNDWLNGNEKKTVSYANAHCINIARQNETYRRTLNDFSIIIPDGKGVSIASQLKGKPFQRGINATDLTLVTFRVLEQRKARFFLLGSKPGVAEIAAKNLKDIYRKTNIAGFMDGFFSAKEEEEVIKRINESRPDVLLVGMGVPRQEIWIHDNKNRIDARIFMAVGGFFDVISGIIKRGPVWMRKAGFEWLYRLPQEPQRLWKRYLLGNPGFLFYTLIDSIKK